LATTLIVFVTAFLLAQTSFAYLSVNETAELVKEDNYRVGLFPQFYLANGGGSNYGAFFDMYIDNDVNARFVIGGGTTDFWTSASAKWVPFPDYQQQPAIGFRGQFTYARDNNLNFYNLQITPIISKIVDTQIGKLNPYIGVPLTLIYSNSSSTTAAQFAVGAEWIDRADFQFGGEIDLNLTNTTTSISLHLNFPFDGNTGFRQ
ncbi:MAG: hypothetical protein ABL930_12665, partial [Pseudobdellovibrio sp.]